MDAGRIAKGVIAQPSLVDIGGSQSLPGSGGLNGGFAGALKNAITDTNNKALESGKQVEALMVGEGSIHRTMIAMQEASVAMDMTIAVRNKVLEAYQEISRMPV